MRLWAIKIIFLAATIVCYSTVTHAKEYDFVFDVNPPELAQKTNATLSESSASTASWRMGMHATLLPDFLKGSGNLVYGGFSENSNTGHSGWDKYLMKLGVSGKQDEFGYGLNFYSVGHEYEDKFNSEYRNKKGYTGYESWLSWNFDKLQVKSKYSEYWTKNPSKVNHVSTLGQWYEVETSYPLTSAPFTELSMVYKLGEKSRTKLSDYVKTYNGPLNSFKARFRFSGGYWKSSSEFVQSSSQNDLDDQRGFKQKMIFINSTLFPENIVSVISSYRFSVNTDSSTAYKKKLNKKESCLGFVYKPTEIPAKLKFTSAYYNFRSDDGLVDTDIVKFGAQFDFNARERNTSLKTSWTMDLQYKDVKDNINPNSSASSWSLNLLWSLPLS